MNADKKIDEAFPKFQEAFLCDLRFSARRPLLIRSKLGYGARIVVTIVFGAFLVPFYFGARIPFLFCKVGPHCTYLLDNANYHNPHIAKVLDAIVIRRRHSSFERQLIVAEHFFVWFSILMGPLAFDRKPLKQLFVLVAKAFEGYLAAIGKNLIRRYRPYVFVKNNNATFSCVISGVFKNNDLQVYCVPHGLVTTLNEYPELNRLASTIIGTADKVVVRTDIWKSLIPEYSVVRDIDGQTFIGFDGQDVSKPMPLEPRKTTTLRILIADTIKDLDKWRKNAYPTKQELLELYQNLAVSLAPLKGSIDLDVSLRTSDQELLDRIKYVFRDFGVCVHSTTPIDILLRRCDCLLTSGSTVIEDAMVAGKPIFLTSDHDNEFHKLFTKNIRINSVKVLPEVVKSTRDLE